MSNGFSHDWKESYLGGSAEAESQLIDQWSQQIQQIQARLREANKAAEIRRAFHAKMLAGIANATFRVVDELPDHLRVGFFQPGAEYPATVRLSSANGAIRADGLGDFRGIAIRVQTGADTVTDFLATNGPVSHARNARQFMAFAWAASGSRLLLFPRLLLHLGPFELIRMLKVLISGTRRPVSSLATEQFWSRGPYKWGPCAVRFTVAPTAAAAPQQPEDQSPDYLRAEFVERLKNGPVTYDFKVQLYTGESTPIEDNARPWDSGFIKVAELIIPQQDLTEAASQASEAAVDQLEFNPWNTTDEFRPLSSLNRARRRVYQASAGHRSGRSNVSV